jgi:membrane protein implicated in regulation of membrane protease activity
MGFALLLALAAAAFAAWRVRARWSRAQARAQARESALMGEMARALAASRAEGAKNAVSAPNLKK